MRLEIRLFAGLKCNSEQLNCTGQDEFYLEVAEGLSVDGLYGHLQLKSSLPLICLVNGLARNKNYILADGDRVGIFPPVGGG